MLHWEIMGLRAAIALLMLMGVGLAVLLGHEVLTPTDSLRAGPVLVEIPAHDGILAIAGRLYQAGAIRSRTGFVMLAEGEAVDVPDGLVVGGRGVAVGVPAGAAVEATTPRACNWARRAARRHLLCLSQAAMPPTATPPMMNTKISANSGSDIAIAGCAWSKGSSETTTICRFATANVMKAIASGTRTSAVTILRIMIDQFVSGIGHQESGVRSQGALVLPDY